MVFKSGRRPFSSPQEWGWQSVVAGGAIVGIRAPLPQARMRMEHHSTNQRSMQEPLVNQRDRRWRADEDRAVYPTRSPGVKRSPQQRTPTNPLRENDAAFCATAQRALGAHRNGPMSPNQALFTVLNGKDRHDLVDAFQYRRETLSTFPVPGEGPQDVLMRQLNSVFGSTIMSLDPVSGRDEIPTGRQGWSGIPLHQVVQLNEPTFPDPSASASLNQRVQHPEPIRQESSAATMPRYSHSARPPALRAPDYRPAISPRRRESTLSHYNYSDPAQGGGGHAPRPTTYAPPTQEYRRANFPSDARDQYQNWGRMVESHPSNGYGPLDGTAPMQYGGHRGESYTHSVGVAKEDMDLRRLHQSQNQKSSQGREGLQKRSPRHYDSPEPASILRVKGEARYDQATQFVSPTKDNQVVTETKEEDRVLNQNSSIVDMLEILPQSRGQRNTTRLSGTGDLGNINDTAMGYSSVRGTASANTEKGDGVLVQTPGQTNQYELPQGTVLPSVSPGGGRVGVRVVQVAAPENLPGGYQFEAQVGKEVFLATVPKDGVVKGEVFNSVMHDVKAKDYLEMNTPHGRWKDGLFSCFAHGICHPMLLTSFCCPQVALTQIMARLRLSAANEKASTLNSRTRVKTVVLSTIALVGLNVFLLFYIISTPYPPIAIAALALLVVIQAPLVFIFLLLVMRARKHTRKAYNIPATQCEGCEDLLVSVWCAPLALAQMGRHTADYEKYRALCCSDTGLAQTIEVVIPAMG